MAQDDKLDNKINDGLNDIIRFLKCPLSDRIFLDPILTPDNKVYEKSEFLKYAKTSETYPNSSLPISKDQTGQPSYTPVVNIKNMIDALLVELPEIKEERYIIK